ncbi:hypothetical protein [Serratia nevei]|uniref:hypothetical protein n=1 Tax=Serratia nevei TaxID=2703794 RepID=UPI002E194748|nr:hypothetical protein [Serratia nevei]
MNSFLHQASFATGYWYYDRHRSVRLVILVGLAIDQIAQSGLSSLSVIYYSAQLFNIQDRLKRTPLVECAYLGRIDHMNLLLKHGANPFIEDRFGENFVDLLDDKIKKTEGNDSLHTRYLELKKQLRVQ